ncbi:putative coactivator CBP, KIX domain-containing protein [Medicago truncatula]|uniref:Mediator of RNA polymerase II transcription subunit 15a, putative n=1 Tax=Medicago truncatula TaxID=3880 RepID=G7JFS6_MEDTR|nr:mediator of RNA polymerase II transcription subunit 15a [Medicago truncatula]XP_024636817.1 mediator of RNA polymerase II transcription subunit 15a [Medicago truncatula]XP_024636818.1 mediator of RNA polymerase II transcription subunit 15a [Medicago truncatula]AES86535.1 mediator of RNA polymerase II transcription subunit 15a, putative [Medicago truncatula]RHN58488.1 putative coactivator CBP, KIX domain-containing protein [Medicago truncatula]
MDSNNWVPNQGTEATADTVDWRTQLQPDQRQRIVNKIMDTLRKHLPVSGSEGLLELRKIAQRFEDKIYTAATSQSDYLRKISMKMLTMENKSQNTMANNMLSNEGGPSNNLPDQGQQHPNPLPNQHQPRQQLLSHNIQNNVAPQPNLSSVSTLPQIPSQNISQNSNTQQPGQNSVSNSIGQNSNVQSMFPGSQRQMSGRPQVVPQQQQQQSQNQQQTLYQQQLLKHKLSQMQQQQQQQNLLQPNQLLSSQQSVIPTSSAMQPSMVQSSLSSLPQNQQSNNVQQSTQSRLQQHSQIIRQQQQNSIVNQQQTPMIQQQHQQLAGPQSNATNGQHAQMLGQQNNVGDVQKSQRLHPQQNNLMNLQQRQQQQQLMNHQNNLTNIHQQPGNNVQGLQQQQQFGTESGNQGIQTSHHSAQMLQQPKVSMQQQLQHNPSKLLPSQSQQSQTQASQQQLMSQIHNQPAQMQQQLGLQQQQNPLQRDMQQKLQASGSLLQQQSVLDQQKQLYQSQRALPETSTTSVDSTTQTAQPNGVDWQEEIYQKLQTMKETYLPEINEIYQKISMKVHQFDSIPQQPKSDQIEKLKGYKTMFERMISILQIPKSSIQYGVKEKLGSYEKQIAAAINQFRPRKAMSSLQPGQLPATHMALMPQSQSQVTSVQSHENQMNSQMQPTNLQGSTSVQQNNIASLQNNSMSSLSTTQQNMLNTIQPSNNLDSGQGNSVNSLQQVPVSSLQQNTVNTQHTNINSLPSQGGVNVIQPNLNTHQPGSNMLQQQQLKHQQEQKMLQNQQFKQQYQQRQMMQRQQQQLHQPAKQQMSAQPQTHQLPQINQMNDMNDVKIRQGLGVKSGVFQQHLTSGQNSTYSHQQMKQGSPFQVSSPQLFQAASPQIPHNSSPQVDQQTHLLSLTKVGTPLQSSNSPFGVPTPSPPMAPSPMLVDSEKPIPGVSSSNAANVGQNAAAPAQSLAIGTPGISASPLLAEFSGPDGTFCNALGAPSGKSTADHPIDRLIRAVQSMSTETLTAAVSDISSVVSMSDRISGSAPGNGSRAAVGEDLVSMTNCRLQARSFITQDGGTTNGIRKFKRHIRGKTLDVGSSAGSMNDNLKQLSASEASQQESTATSNVKKPKAEVNHALLEELQQINRRLIDTIVDISTEDVDSTAAAAAAAEWVHGTIVKCSFIPVSLSPSLKSQYVSLQSPIQPLRLLVPPNYPNCSPIFIDKFPVESRKGNEDLSEKAKVKFSMSLRNLSQPMSLKDIAMTWDASVRGVISEYAQQFGGGTFSAKYGDWQEFTSWEDLLAA